MEAWKPIKICSVFAVSNYGRVKRIKPGGTRAIVGKIMKLYTNSQGYMKVQLQRKNHFVHRLVLEAFVGSCPEGHECNHKNGIKNDNHISNLEWITPSQNTKHSYDLGLQPKRKSRGRKWLQLE